MVVRNQLMRIAEKNGQIFLLLILTAGILATAMTGNADADQIKIQAGVCVYPDPRSAPAVYVEFPFVIHRSQFTFLPDDSTGKGLLAAVFAEIQVTDTLGNPVDSTSTYFLTKAADSADARNDEIRLFNKLSLLVRPGTYSAKLTVMDAVGKNEGSFLYDRLNIERVVTDRIHLSSLEFAYKITLIEDSSALVDTRLVKNSRQVIPNPMGVFSEGDSSIYVYAELYNLYFDTGVSDTFTLHYTILNSDGSLCHDFGELLQDKPGSSSVISNVLSIDGLEPGRYHLRLIAQDFTSGTADTSSRRFVLFPKSGELPQVVSFARKSPYDTLSLETRENLVRFLMAPQQLVILETLNDTGKVRFIDQFFSDRDPDPSTEKNEFLEDVYNRYLYSNQKFSTLPGLTDGWKSDRGRVLLQYGIWSEREEVPAPSYGKPWEKWTYYALQGGAIFVFQDVDGYGHFELVHSTAIGEIYSKEWEQALRDNEPMLFK